MPDSALTDKPIPLHRKCSFGVQPFRSKPGLGPEQPGDHKDEHGLGLLRQKCRGYWLLVMLPANVRKWNNLKLLPGTLQCPITWTKSLYLLKATQFRDKAGACCRHWPTYSVCHWGNKGIILEVQILTDLAFSKQNGKYVACKLQIICNSCCLLNSSPLAGFGSHSPEKLKCRWLVHMEAWPQNGLGVGR